VHDAAFVLALHLDARLLADACEGLFAGVLEPGDDGQLEDREAAPRAGPPFDELHPRS